MTNFEELFMDLVRSLIPAMVINYSWNNSILMYYVPMITMIIYIVKKMSGRIRWRWSCASITLKTSIHYQYNYGADKNFYYAVMHYLSIHNTSELDNGNYLIPDSSSELSSRSSSDFVSMKLSLDTTRSISVQHNGKKFYLTGYSDEKEKITNLFLIIKGENTKCIKEFIEYCYQQYTKYISEQSKKRQTFINGSEKPKWKSSIINLHKTFDNLYIDEKVKNDLIFDVKMFVSSEERYKHIGAPYKRGYLFYGPPGTGKSSSYYAIEHLTGFNIYKLSLNGISETAATKLIADIPPKSILVIDDIDRIDFKAEIINDKNEKSIDMQKILTILDGYDYLHECIVIMTTNYIDKLDNALIRSGRIDYKVEISYPSYHTVNTMFQRIYDTDQNIPMFAKFFENNKCILSTADILQRIILPNSDYSSAVKCFSFICGF